MLNKQKQTHTNNKTQPTTNKKKNVQTPLPLGRSYIDYLPNDILTDIYKMKHNLEFKDTLNLISRLRVALDYDIAQAHIPIKRLLKKATHKKQIYINVLPFDCSNLDNANNHNKAILKKEFNTDKILVHKGMFSLTQLEIKKADTRPILIVDVLYFIYILGLTKRFDKEIVDLIIDDLQKSSMISFELA